MKEARYELKAIVRRLIAERRQSGLARADVLGRLLASQADPGGGPTDEAIIQECIGFLFAGHETTASTLTWALYSLAIAPDVQERVAREGDRLVTGASRLMDAVDGLAGYRPGRGGDPSPLSGGDRHRSDVTARH